MAEEAVPLEAVEVDPKKLISKNGVIGYEKAEGFQAMTNFDVAITGFVAESSGAVIGYLAEVRLDIVDDDAENTSRTKEYFLSNKDMSSHQSLINALKRDAIWTQPTKEPYLPDYVYGLCRKYSKTTPVGQRRKKIPVRVIGKQPEGDVWVFNDSVQINAQGQKVQKEEQQYIVLDDSRLPFLRGLKENIDDGAALRQLIEAQKELLGNNFPQAVMTLACCAIGANYSLIVKEYGGCGLPVLYGAPQSAKTTALKAALSVFGESDIVQDMTFKGVMDRASSTTIPFGWDDAENSSTMKQVAVAFFNQGGTLSYHGRLVPKTFPIMTTNVDGKSLKVLSRWMRIPFKEIKPLYRSREYRERYQQLQEAMSNASSSIAILTSFAAKILSKKEDVDGVTEELNTICDRKELKIDQRAMLSFSLLLFVCKMILSKVELEPLIKDIDECMETVVLPSYMNASAVQLNTTQKATNKQTSPLIKDAIWEFLNDISEDSVHGVAAFLINKIQPKSCTCGEAVAFNVPAVVRAIKAKNPVTNITDGAVRTYIVEQRIGCVGKSTKFLKHAHSISSAHISRAFITHEVLQGLDRAYCHLNKVPVPRRPTKASSNETHIVQSAGITVEESDEDKNNSSKEQQNSNSDIDDCDAGDLHLNKVLVPRHSTKASSNETHIVQSVDITDGGSDQGKNNSRKGQQKSNSDIDDCISVGDLHLNKALEPRHSIKASSNETHIVQSVSITDEESDEDENNSSKEQQKDNSGFGDCDAGRRIANIQNKRRQESQRTTSNKKRKGKTEAEKLQDSLVGAFRPCRSGRRNPDLSSESCKGKNQAHLDPS